MPRAPAIPCVSIMSQNEIPSGAAPRICVKGKSSQSNIQTLGADPVENEHQIRESHPSAGVPVTAGPYDVWHSEAYLIAWLVRCHGWRVMEPGLLRRVTGLDRSVTLPVNREAGRRQLRQLRGAA
jgi:hypothetical protein